MKKKKKKKEQKKKALMLVAFAFKELPYIHIYLLFTTKDIRSLTPLGPWISNIDTTNQPVKQLNGWPFCLIGKHTNNTMQNVQLDNAELQNSKRQNWNSSIKNNKT